jgi:DNA-binding SARP family transcriptional activator
VEFRILGPLEVVEGGETLRLGSRKQRALLALFILHAGEVVSRDRLIDDLWHGEPPPAADATLRAHVSRLRAALGASRLLSRAPGYTLVLAPEELDAAHCERLLAEGREALAHGRAGDAAERLRTALALFRGAVLADVGYETFAQGEIGRLEELRLAVLEERIEADLALARHADVVGELEALVADYPLRERPRGQLMLALYRCGRQADALESYQQARRVLTEELGLEPSEALSELQRGILVHDASLQPPSRLEAESVERDESSAPFVGRERELGELVRGLEQALAGQGRLFLISGEPGIGKSRLVEQLIRRARRRGAEVAVGRSWEAGGAPAYWPWVQALRTYVRGRDADLLRVQLGRGASELAQILPEFSELYPELPAPPATDPEGARFRLFDATRSFLFAASLTQPLVLVFDDLHAADTASLLLLRFLSDGLADTRVLVICAYRDVDPTPSDTLVDALAAIRGQPVTRSLALGGLREDAVGRFVALTTGDEPTADLEAALHRATGGNPLFVGEVVRLLESEAALASITDSETWRRMVPEGVRAVIRRRVRHLSENCRLVLVLASVLGQEFELAALERVSEVSADQLLGVLDEAARERVVADVPGQPGRIRFTHVLIRDTVYDDLTPGRRMQLHRRVGDALEELYGDNVEAHLAELAHHFYESARPAVAGKALTYARRAAERSQRQLAYEEAARLYLVSLRILDRMESPDGSRRCELLLALGDAYARAGDTSKAKETYRDAARLAEELRLPEQLGQAALGYGGRFIWDASRDDEHLAKLLDSALTALGEVDSPLRVRLLARLAGGPLRVSTADAGRRRSLGVQALEMARRIGDPATLAYALHGYLSSHLSPDFTREQAELAKELIDVAVKARDTERAVEGYQIHLESSIELGDLPSAHADLETMTALADELGQPAQKWLAGAYRTALALLEGRFGEAEQLIDAARSIGVEAQRWDAVVTHGLQLYVLRRDQGRVEEVESLVRRAAIDYPTYPIWRCVLANMLAELGSTEEARAALEGLAADNFGAIPFDEEWEVGLCFLAETAARLGETSHAAALYELLLPYADKVALSYPEISLGPISRFLGIVAATVRRYDDATRHFEDAVRTSERIGARPWLAHAREDYAHTLLRRAEPGDAEKARTLLDSALAIRKELGMCAPAPYVSAVVASTSSS